MILSTVDVDVNFLGYSTWADPEGGRGSGPPGKSPVAMEFKRNTDTDPLEKRLDPRYGPSSRSNETPWGPIACRGGRGPIASRGGSVPGGPIASRGGP